MITDKSKYGHDAVLDVNCGDSVQVLRTEPMTLTEQEQKIVQKYLGIALLEKSYIDANGHLMVVLSDGRTLDVGSARGLPGATPYLGENGNWFVEGVDTLQSARGLPGFTPYIGENEHWWIDETDTGIPARGIPLTEKADNTRFLRNDGTWQKVTPENIGAAKQSDFAAQKSIVSDHTTRIEALEQRTVTAPYYTDDSVAYTKDVPENALPFASVDMIGGMTRKCTNLLDESILTDGSNWQYAQIKALPNTTYTAVGNVPVKDGLGLFVGNSSFQASGEGNQLYGNIARTFTTNADGIIKLQWITIDANYTFSSYNFMLNSGDTALPYEPYFDGLRSAPVTEVESVGVNLFNEGLLAGELGVTKTSDGYYRASSNHLISAIHATQNISYVKNTQYSVTIEGYKDDSSAVGQRGLVVIAHYTDGTTETLIDFSNKTNALKKATTKVSKSVESLEWSFGSSVVVNYFKDISVKKGTDATYTPYRRNTLPIPAEVQALDGYGWGVNDKVYNYIDWERKQFVKRVGRVDLGASTWIAFGTNLFSTGLNGASLSDGGLTASNIIAPRYTNANYRDTLSIDGTISAYVSNGYGMILVHDSKYTDAATFKAAMQGVMLYYELTEPVITDISDILPADNLIRVESGGTVTMVNEYRYDVPSEITYARLTLQ